MEAKSISFLTKLAFLIVFFFFGLSNYAQENYRVNGEEVSLYEEEAGKLTLLTERSNESYRFFLKRERRIEELTRENYIQVLKEFTADINLDLKDVNFNRRDLSHIVFKYNSGGEDGLRDLSDIGFRLGTWFGQSNFSSFSNDENDNLLFAGLEFEMYGKTSYSRNSIIAQLRFTSPSDDDYQLDVAELMLGYRFKVIDQDFFHLYLEAELVTFGRYKEQYSVLSAEDELEEFSQTNTALSAPLGLGAGMAFRIFSGTYLTLGYANLVKIGESTRSDFPIDYRLGIKFNL